MATLILPSIDQLAVAAAELIDQAPDNRPRQNAINKAILMLHQGAEPTLTAGGILIESRTRNLVHRVSTVHGCNCEAGANGKACWHAALVEIVEQAQIRSVPTAVRERAAIMARQAAAQFALDECYA